VCSLVSCPCYTLFCHFHVFSHFWEAYFSRKGLGHLDLSTQIFAQQTPTRPTWPSLMLLKLHIQLNKLLQQNVGILHHDKWLLLYMMAGRCRRCMLGQSMYILYLLEICSCQCTLMLSCTRFTNDANLNISRKDRILVVSRRLTVYKNQVSAWSLVIKQLFLFFAVF